jgi:hypothetical protein
VLKFKLSSELEITAEESGDISGIWLLIASLFTIKFCCVKELARIDVIATNEMSVIVAARNVFLQLLAFLIMRQVYWALSIKNDR